MIEEGESLTKEITQMANYKPDRPTDLFQYYHPEIRSQFIDAYNLCRIWVQGFLYWKGVYPQEAFQIKTSYSRKIYIVKSTILREYLDRFFQSVCQNIEYLNFIEIQLFQLGQNNIAQFVEGERFHISFQSKLSNSDDLHQIKRKGLNTIQKEIEYKRFLGKMEEELNKGYYRPIDKKCTFELSMGYKWDHKNKQSKHRSNLLHKWTEVEKNNTFQKKTVNHAGTGELEILCEKICLVDKNLNIESE